MHTPFYQFIENLSGILFLFWYVKKCTGNDPAVYRLRHAGRKTGFNLSIMRRRDIYVSLPCSFLLYWITA